MTHVAKKAADEGWSVRQMEQAAKARKGGDSASGSSVRQLRPVEIIELENRLAEHLGTRVKINYRNEKGKVEIRLARSRNWSASIENSRHDRGAGEETDATRRRLLSRSRCPASLLIPPPPVPGSP